MFEQTFVESRKTIKTNWRRTTVISFVLQGLVIGFVAILPLLFTQALPTKDLSTLLVAPPPPPPPPPPAGSTAEKPQPVAKISPTAELRTPTRIPQRVQTVNEQQSSAAPPPSTVAGVVGGVPGGTVGGSVGGVLGGVLSSTPANIPPKPNAQRVKVSQGVTQGLLVHQVKPSYPPLTRQGRIQGSVVLHALIGKDGKVENLQIVSGHPMLSSAAVDAVKQWRHKPYFLNGQPVEVETNITVIFLLSA